MRNWRNFVWQITGTILALAAVFATYHVFIKSKPVKKLQMVVDSSVSLVDVKPEAIQDIEIYYKGQKVKNIVLLQLSIKNIGNQPIVESDYSENISLTFDEETKIIDMSIISSEPANIKIPMNIVSSNQVDFSPFLLNPGDIVKFRLITVGTNGSPMTINVAGRIVGIKELKIATKSETSTNDVFIIIVIVALFTTILTGSIGFIINILNYRTKQ